MTKEQTAKMVADFKALEEQNAALVAKLADKTNKPMSIKIAAKGGVSVYGLGRYPVTFYRETWGKLISKMPDIEAFIKANSNDLKFKDSAEDLKRVMGGGKNYPVEEK